MILAAVAASAIIGNFNCVTTASGKPAMHFRSINRAWGPWVNVHASFPAQNGLPPILAQVFLGFDPAAKRWSIVTLNDDGSYYTRHSTSPALNGSRWVDNFPADGATAVIHLTPGGDYVFDFTPKPGGTDVPSHTVCMRDKNV